MEDTLKKMLESIEAHLGEKIRERRLYLKLKQIDIARRVGLSTQQIDNCEKGLYRIPASRLYRLSKILHVPIGFFYDGLEKECSPSKAQGLVVTCANLKGKKVKIEFLNLNVILTDDEILNEEF